MTETNRAHVALLVSTFAIAACGLVYELLAGTVSSYLLGDSIYQFSIVIGIFMAAMGFGSFLSRYVVEHLSDTFILVQLTVGIVGGFSALGLFFAFAYLGTYEPLLVLISVAIGILIGIEIPLVIRMLRDYQVLKLNVSNVLTVDYVGALIAALLFPIVLVPHLGLIRTGLFFGALNVFVAGVALYTFRGTVHRPRVLLAGTLGTAAVLVLSFLYSDRMSGMVENRLYSGEIVYSESTPYQRIVVTRDQGVTSLFINGALQFSSLDEYRYHESMVHPAMAAADRHDQVLVLGGGDGLAVREVLKYRDVHEVTLVDIDPAVTNLFALNPLLSGLNGGALTDERVEIRNEDAAQYLQSTQKLFDVVIIDLPDPHDIGISRLYTRWFYTLVAKRMSAQGVMVTQATSPLYARQAFWCITETIGSVRAPFVADSRFETVPYHTYVPTFGDWGFVLAASRPIDLANLALTVPTRYLTRPVLGHMALFPPDMSRVEAGVNTLQTHILTDYYQAGWGKWYR